MHRTHAQQQEDGSYKNQWFLIVLQLLLHTIAVELGYRIIKIHEVWHFPDDRPKEGLFAEYVNKFLKAKQESSGWPSDCFPQKFSFTTN